ncbi:MAG: hydantoinase B/oxoprolinase family protein, partial [Dehalococcoidia bacterium]
MATRTKSDLLGTTHGIDPITFEILRHRLWAINDESATALRLVSGSPVANEAFDMNTALMNAAGDDFVIGTFIAIHALSMNIMAKDVLTEYSENPGINPGDTFLCNDPYVGCQHQMDAIVLSPIHYKDELVAWTGATVHNIDLDGPNEGQVQLDAESIFGEQPILPPIKVVEGGVLRKDLERAWTRRSRLPELVALDFRAKLAANNVARQRLIELIDEYGLGTITTMMDAIIDHTEARFRGRLRELPDGVWRHRSYIDYKEDLYRIVLTMTKKDETLHLDFRGTDKQAPAVINCTWAGLRSAFMASILAYLCFDMPWCPAGVMRAIEVESEPGTVIHSEFPAGVCKATTTASWSATNVTAACLGKMLAASDKWRDHAMALWQGTQPIEDVFGYDQRGRYFGATILDCMAGGTGARSNKDGINTGGFIVSMSGAIANVEAYEFRYPMLYLYRKHMPDTAGPGRFRGGVGASMMYVCHDVDWIPTKIMHTYGVEVP